uniref:Uncharacterized protein n=1 Tax=Globisporangium ultimum (strain ATCC 200006 / CBS 805.95 / DAOM BR144) TaxID=431595 RepID=K3X697_GLOUD
MAVAALSWVNAALFAAQLYVNGAMSRNIGPMSRKHETFITPAPYAFSIWGLIYTLLTISVIVDCGCPTLSIYAGSAHATLLRAVFAVSCVMNLAWIVLFSSEYINVATAVLVVLWVALFTLYVHIINHRRERGFSYTNYFLGELPIITYFAWTCAATLISFAVTFQDFAQDYLSLTSYLVLVAILSVATLSAVIFEGELAFGFVAIWALRAISVKELNLEQTVEQTSLSVRACAALSATIIGAFMVITVILRVLNRHRGYQQLERAMPFLSEKNGHLDYGTSSL